MQREYEFWVGEWTDGNSSRYYSCEIHSSVKQAIARAKRILRDSPGDMICEVSIPSIPSRMWSANDTVCHRTIAIIHAFDM